MFKIAFAILVLLCSLFCASWSARGESTVGQQFRDIMAEIDAKCRKEKLGPYLEQSEPPGSRKRTDGSCEILKIKPGDPLATIEGRFAYTIKLPSPHDKPKVDYKKGMSAETYFKELCEKEAGEWIFKTVERVEGVFQARRLEPYSVGYSDLVFYTREVAGVLSDRPEDYLVQPYHGRYNYLEIPSAKTHEGEQRFSRFFRGAEVAGHRKVGTQKNKRLVHVPYIVHTEQTDSLKSTYGYTWRQLVDKDAMENGIVGGELIIYDKTSNEVLAFRRFFLRHWPREDSRFTRLVNGEGCQPGFTKGEYVFIQKILVPINPVE